MARRLDKRWPVELVLRNAAEHCIKLLRSEHAAYLPNYLKWNAQEVGAYMAFARALHHPRQFYDLWWFFGIAREALRRFAGTSQDRAHAVEVVDACRATHELALEEYWTKRQAQFRTQWAEEQVHGTGEPSDP